MGSGQTFIEMKNICKGFSGVEVLHCVDFAVSEGEVRALVGENGAGKSTLMKILGGIQNSNSGEIFINGEKKPIQSVFDAINNGIAIIHQEIVLVPALSIEENIFLGREFMTKFGFVDKATCHKRTKELMAHIGMGDIDTRTLVKDLSISQQQMVEIARALSTDSKLIVMDEPTSSLTDKEVVKLFEQINKLKAKGVSIIYISHKMDEIFTIADSVTVMRDGNHVLTKPVSQTSYSEIIRSMVGHEIKDYYPKYTPKIGGTILEVKNLTTDKVNNISFTIREGEILGLSGLVGAGRTELAQALFGIDKIHSGEIWYKGNKMILKSPRDAIRQGIALVPEDRKALSLFLTNTISYNMTITVIDSFMRFIFTDYKKEHKIINEYTNQLAIKMAGPNQRVLELSGGNQQKIVISKWLAASPRVLILDEPTRGIDVGAKSEIYHLMVKIAAQGVAIIMISSELPEVINISTRIGVMSEGELKKILDLSEEEITQEKIMHYATGGYENGQQHFEKNKMAN